jgi:hypothetical protein
MLAKAFEGVGFFPSRLEGEHKSSFRCQAHCHHDVGDPSPAGRARKHLDIHGEVLKWGAVQVGSDMAVWLLHRLRLFAYGTVQIGIKVTGGNTLEHRELATLYEGVEPRIVEMAEALVPDV